MIPLPSGPVDGCLIKTVAELAPNLIKSIPKRIIRSRMVAHAVLNRRWLADVKDALTLQVLVGYLLVWDLVDGLDLQQGIPDNFRWKLFQSGSYSSKSVYAAFFVGAVKYAPWKRFWKDGHPCASNFLCGLLLIIGAGQQAGSQREDCPTRICAHSATRLRSPYSTY